MKEAELIKDQMEKMESRPKGFKVDKRRLSHQVCSKKQTVKSYDGLNFTLSLKKKP